MLWGTDEITAHCGAFTLVLMVQPGFPRPAPHPPLQLSSLPWCPSVVPASLLCHSPGASEKISAIEVLLSHLPPACCT